MYISTDNSGLILAYSTIGQIDGGQKYSGSVPEDKLWEMASRPITSK
ncbi:hypothetical protein [Loigolactobacillus zhaoyuanensis]|nr:hypothetical protein [Loigolactobacillus zhaoyuanensis]